MPKVSVYLSDEMYAAARRRELSLSALLQGAIEAALDQAERRSWAERQNRGDRGIGIIDTVAVVAGRSIGTEP